MVISSLPYEPQQEMLLPASLQDWLPKGHLADFISDTVDALGHDAFYARCAGGGALNQPFHPVIEGQGAGLRVRHGRVATRR